jgi:hypothetical protein
MGIDVADPAKPRIVSWFPTPRPAAGLPYRSYQQKGARIGPHNQHQWQGQDCLRHDDSRVYLTHFNAGLRVYDISDRYYPREIAYYVPTDPEERRGVKPAVLRTQFEDLIVDDRGYVYCTDKNHGLFALALS